MKHASFSRLTRLVYVGLFGLSFLSYSCSGKGDSSEDVKPEIPNKSEAMSPLDQKRKMQDIATQFINEIPASDFDNISSLLGDLSHDYEDYDWDYVEDWAKKCWEDCLQNLGTPNDRGDNNSYYTTYYTNYKLLLLLSNFTGHFTAQDGEWKYSMANDLQFIMPQHGSVVKLTTSGQVKKVYIGDLEEWDYEYYANYCDIYKSTIAIPENITFSLTQNGSDVIKVTLTFDLSNIEDEKFDISKSSLSVTALTEFNNGYRFNLSKCSYTANNSLSSTFTISKNDKTLVTMAISGDVKNIPSYNLDAFTTDNLNEEQFEEDMEDANINNAFVKFDLMGKLQIQGKVTDVHKFVDKLLKAEDNSGNEDAFISYISQANDLMDINLFYDGTSVTQAYIELQPYFDEDWYDDMWYAEPVICFYDGSSYSTFESFFNEYDFDDLIDTFEKLLDDYEDMVD